MSKGSRVVTVRIPPDMLARIDLQIRQRNIYTLNKPWNMSDWIKTAMEEKLAKMERSRRGRGRKPPPATE